MHTAATAEAHHTLPAADERESALPFRGDTFLGVCEAVGQDLGFHANWLRIPFAALILWNPAAIIAAYLGLGCVVATARWFYPAESKAAALEGGQPSAADQSPAAIENAKSQELLAA